MSIKVGASRESYSRLAVLNVLRSTFNDARASRLVGMASEKVTR